MSDLLLRLCLARKQSPRLKTKNIKTDTKVSNPNLNCLFLIKFYFEFLFPHFPQFFLNPSVFHFFFKMLPPLSSVSSTPVSSSPSPCPSSAFSPKIYANKSATTGDKKRHRLRPTDCCCWIAFDLHANWLYYVPVFEEDILRAKAMEPNVLAKSICTSIKSFKSLRQQPQLALQLNDLTALFAHVCSIIYHHCAADDETNGMSPPPCIPIKAVIVVPTNCSEAYEMAVEGAAEAAGIGQVHLIRRATALAISYRMLLLEEDEANLLLYYNPIKRTETDGAETAAEGQQQATGVIVQLDDDDEQQMSDIERRRDKFVAILYVCEHYIELFIYDFLSHHLPRLISSKRLFVANPIAHIDLINKFLRRHLIPFHFKLLKLLTAGAPELIAHIVPALQKLIAFSCQLLTKCAMVPSDLIAIFGAALNSVHLMLSEGGTDRSPLFLSRSMMPANFDYNIMDNGGADEKNDAAAEEKLRAEIEAIDEGFIKTFGLHKQKMPKAPEPSNSSRTNRKEKKAKEAQQQPVTKPTTKAAASDVTALPVATAAGDEKQRKESSSSSTTTSATTDATTITANAASTEKEEEAFFDAILTPLRDEPHLQQQRHACAKKKLLTDDELRVLADVITSRPPSTATNVSTAARDSVSGVVYAAGGAADATVNNNNKSLSLRIVEQQQKCVAARTSDSSFSSHARRTLASVKQQHAAADTAPPRQFDDSVEATSSGSTTNSNDNNFNASFSSRATVFRRFSDPSLLGHCDSSSTLRFKTDAVEKVAENVDNLEANKKMRWEETDDEEEEGREEDDEIETLGEDRSVIGGEQAAALLSSSESPSLSSSIALGLEEDDAVENEEKEEEQNDGAEDDDTETLDDDSNGTTAPTLTTTEEAEELNRWGQPVDNVDEWAPVIYEGLSPLKFPRRSKASRNRNKRPTTTVTTAPPLGAVQMVGRPSSRASTLQAMSDDENEGDGMRRRTGTNNSSTTINMNNKGKEYGDDAEDDDDDDHVDLLLSIFGAQRPLPGKFSANIERQFYRSLPMFGEGECSSIQLIGLPLLWICDKFFQQELKEWLRIRSALHSKAELINCFITFSVTANNAFRICQQGMRQNRFSKTPYNGTHNKLFVYALLPTPEVAWHVCWACNQFDDNLGTYWPTKYGQVQFRPTVAMAGRQTFLGETTDP